MASHAGFHDVGAFPQSFESFPFLYVQIPFSHFTGKWPCRYPKTPAASLFSASNLQEKASKWCNQSPPAQKLDPNYVKNSVKSPCFPSPFRQTFRCLTHTHTPSTAQLVRCFTHPDLHRMSADVRCDLSSQELNQTPPGSPCLGTWVRRSRNPYNGSTGSFTQISCTTQCILYPIPSIGLEYLHFSWFLW